MKVLFLTQFFYPDIQATSRIFTELCEDLIKQFKLTVVCGYPLVEVSSSLNKRAAQPDFYNRATISRVFSTQLKKKNLFNRIINWLSFAVFSYKYILAQPKTGVFIFTSDNPFNSIPALFFPPAKRIYICQDLYWEQIKAVGIIKRNISYRVFGMPLILLQKLALKYAGKIIVISESMRLYLEDGRVGRDKIKVVPNWANTNAIVPSEQDNAFSRQHGLNEKFVILYAGRIGLTQDLGILLDCAGQLRSYSDMKFVIIGEGARRDYFISLAKKKRLDNLVFLPYQPEEIFNYVLATASISVIPEKSDISSFLMPSKLYNIMASARPVIAAVDKISQTAQVINNAQCGSIITPGSSQELMDSILKIYENRDLIEILGNNGREYVVNNFSRLAMTSKYRLLVKETVEQ